MLLCPLQGLEILSASIAHGGHWRRGCRRERFGSLNWRGHYDGIPVTVAFEAHSEMAPGPNARACSGAGTCWACRPCTRLGNAEHGTTFQTEDQLIISPDLAVSPRTGSGGGPSWERAAGGYLPLSGDIASRPQRTIDEFQQLITFATPSHDCASQCLFPERQKKSTCEGAARVSERARNRRGVGRPLDVPVKRGTPDSVPVVPDDLKIDIAHVFARSASLAWIPEPVRHACPTRLWPSSAAGPANRHRCLVAPRAVRFDGAGGPKKLPPAFADRIPPPAGSPVAIHTRSHG